jgi:adenine phosphoribosyltransferase
MDLEGYIRSIPDFPKKGIVFRDITPLLSDPTAFRAAVKALCGMVQEDPIDCVVAVESRGFIFGGAVAYRLGAGLVPVRKPGKLPSETIREEYALEYGTDALEIHRDAISQGSRVLVLDDLLATGGTAAATCRLVETLGGIVVRVVFLIELASLKGRLQLGDRAMSSIIRYP